MASPQPNFARTASSCAHGKFTPLYRINAAERPGIGSLSAQRRANWLVVITIIALVATLVGPRVSELLSDAKVKAAKIQMERFETALDLYYLDNGSFPAADEGLKALVQRPASAPVWNGPYLRTGSVPDDPWGHPYVYRVPGEHAPYEIASYGPGRTSDAGYDREPRAIVGDGSAGGVTTADRRERLVPAR